jgi:ribosomal protein S18 acetylase RimI-like enzyme
MEFETSIHLVQDADTQDSVRKTVNDALTQSDRRYTPEAIFEALVIAAATPGNKIIGGLVGQTCPNWRWARITMLWVEEPYRTQGIGRKLLRAAEVEAARQGCHYMQLETFSFQARGFYEKDGYVVFGEQEDFPPGHRRFYLSKKLSPE